MWWNLILWCNKFTPTVLGNNFPGGTSLWGFQQAWSCNKRVKLIGEIAIGNRSISINANPENQNNTRRLRLPRHTRRPRRQADDASSFATLGGNHNYKPFPTDNKALNLDFPLKSKAWYFQCYFCILQYCCIANTEIALEIPGWARDLDNGN